MATPYEYASPTIEQRARFSKGPWDGELDCVEWQAHGLDCCILRHASMGHLCGYVRITPEHPLYNDERIEYVVDVHGGVTYDRRDAFEDRWIGFDCAHSWDLMPTTLFKGDSTYRDIDYVRKETERLAEQLAAKPAIDKALGGL